MRHTFSFSILALGALGILMVVGCGPALAPSKAVSALTPEEAQGREVYGELCASCHYADKTGDLHGPSLFGLFRKPYMPSGAPANDVRVTAVILHGHGMMPGYEGQLDAQHLQELVAYLHTL